MSWNQLLDIIRESRDLVASGKDIEYYVCPNDGEPLTQGPGGELRCRFDGFSRSGSAPSPSPDAT